MATPNIALANAMAASGADSISPDGNPTAQTQQTTPVVAPPRAEQPIVKPEVNEPVIEEKESDDTLDFSSFLDAAGKEPEVKVAETVQPKIETKPNEVSKRDYSGLSDDERIIFRDMDRKSFEKLKPIYLEHKKQKEVLTAKDNEISELKKRPAEQPSVYEQEEAYILLPEFRQALQKQQLAESVFNHWTRQLNEVRAGAKEISIIQLNPQTNQLYEAGKVPADINSETQLLTYFNFAQQQLMNAQAEARGIQYSYKNTYSQQAEAFKQMENEFFNVFEKPDKKAEFGPVIEQQLNRIPPAFRTSPVAKALAKSLTMNIALANLLKQAANERSAAPSVRSKQPSAAEAAGDGRASNSNDKDSVDFNDFEKIKGGY